MIVFSNVEYMNSLLLADARAATSAESGPAQANLGIYRWSPSALSRPGNPDRSPAPNPASIDGPFHDFVRCRRQIVEQPPAGFTASMRRSFEQRQDPFPFGERQEAVEQVENERDARLVARRR